MFFGKITYLNLEKDPDIIFNDKEFENKNLYIEDVSKWKIIIKKINPLIDVCLHHRTTDYNFVIESLFLKKL